MRIVMPAMATLPPMPARQVSRKRTHAFVPSLITISTMTTVFCALLGATRDTLVMLSAQGALLGAIWKQIHGDNQPMPSVLTVL